MTNAEKYPTLKERYNAFRKTFGTKCEDCECLPVCSCDLSECVIRWLEREAEEEQTLPCPFCGGSEVVIQDVGGFELVCMGCGFHTPSYMSREKLIAEYQRVARAVMEAGKKEETP